ncbi:MAG: LysM peptidoglycan-binding domain-containing protein [Candidatus Woesearchaeota archaeon]
MKKYVLFFVLFIGMVSLVNGADLTCDSQYVVQKGDSAWDLWNEYEDQLDIDWAQFQTLNPHIDELNIIDIGDVLCLSNEYKKIKYTVKARDTLLEIWQKYAKPFGLTSWDEFVSVNEISDINLIDIGEQFVISKKFNKKQRDEDGELIMNSKKIDYYTLEYGDDLPALYRVFDYANAIEDVVSLNKKLNEFYEDRNRDLRHSFYVVTFPGSGSFYGNMFAAYLYYEKIGSPNANSFLIVYYKDDKFISVIGADSKAEYTKKLYEAINGNSYLTEDYKFDLGKTILNGILEVTDLDENSIQKFFGFFEDWLKINKDERKAKLENAIYYAKKNSIVERTCDCGDECEDYAKLILENSEKNNIDPLLSLSLMMQESSCNSEAKSGTSCGLYQIPCETSNWKDPEINVPKGHQILREKYGYFNHNVCSLDKDCKPKFVNFCGTENCRSDCSDGYCYYEFVGCGSNKRQNDNGHLFYSGWNAAIRAYNGWGCDTTLKNQDKFADEVWNRYLELKKV